MIDSAILQLFMGEISQTGSETKGYSLSVWYSLIYYVYAGKRNEDFFGHTKSLVDQDKNLLIYLCVFVWGVIS